MDPFLTLDWPSIRAHYDRLVSPENQDTRALEIRVVRARESEVMRRRGGEQRADWRGARWGSASRAPDAVAERCSA
jgi:hypothetical protein